MYTGVFVIRTKLVCSTIKAPKIYCNVSHIPSITNFLRLNNIVSTIIIIYVINICFFLSSQRSRVRVTNSSVVPNCCKFQSKFNNSIVSIKLIMDTHIVKTTATYTFA